jgi:hypothetical protein
MLEPLLGKTSQRLPSRHLRASLHQLQEQERSKHCQANPIRQNDDDVLFQNAIHHPQYEAATEQQERLEGDVVSLAGRPRLLELRQVGCGGANRRSEANYRNERAHGSHVSD